MTLDQLVGQIEAALDISVPRPVTAELGLVDDLGLDSFQVFELMIIVETLADCLLAPEDPPILITLGDVHEYYRLARASSLAP
jgi:acyl carrier protein